MIKLSNLKGEIVDYEYSTLEGMKYKDNDNVEQLAKGFKVEEGDVDFMLYYIAYNELENKGIETITLEQLEDIQSTMQFIQLHNTIKDIKNKIKNI